MRQFPIGVMLESFRLETKEAVEKAAQLGAQGLQVSDARRTRAGKHDGATRRERWIW